MGEVKKAFQLRDLVGQPKFITNCRKEDWAKLVAEICNITVKKKYKNN